MIVERLRGALSNPERHLEQRIKRDRFRFGARSSAELQRASRDGKALLQQGLFLIEGCDQLFGLQNIEPFGRIDLGLWLQALLELADLSLELGSGSLQDRSSRLQNALASSQKRP